MLKAIKNNIPNTITCMNLLSGCVATIFAFKGQEMFGALTGYEMAFVLIGMAAIFDFCDGASARMLNAYSLLGKELDSLSDLISFGLAPAMLMFNTMNDHNDGGWASYIALAIAVGGALRLAKFNIDDRQMTSFIGLPIPANAIFWIGVCAWTHQNGYPGDGVMAVMLVLVSLLMISGVRMFSLKFKNFNWKENFKRYAIIFAGIMFILCYGISGLAWTILVYILISALSRKRDE